MSIQSRLTVLPVILALAGCTTAVPGPSAGGERTPHETPSAEAAASPSPSTDESGPSPSSTSDGELGFDAGQDCENQELAFRLEYPAEWWANERVEPEEEALTPIPACTYFAPQPVELQPNAGLPNGLAIWFQIPRQEIDPGGEVLAEEKTVIDDHDAVRLETEPEPQAGFVPEGSLVYRYVIELDDGRQLVAMTDNIHQDDAGYEESKGVLDTMMETLEIED